MKSVKKLLARLGIGAYYRYADYSLFKPFLIEGPFRSEFEAESIPTWLAQIYPVNIYIVHRWRKPEGVTIPRKHQIHTK
jgi:hypothetical protein